MIFLGERLSFRQSLGAVFVVIGAILLALK